MVRCGKVVAATEGGKVGVVGGGDGNDGGRTKKNETTVLSGTQNKRKTTTIPHNNPGPTVIAALERQHVKRTAQLHRQSVR